MNMTLNKRKECVFGEWFSHVEITLFNILTTTIVVNEVMKPMFIVWIQTCFSDGGKLILHIIGL